MSTLSTHVLDAALGRPASGLAVELTGGSGPVDQTTDDDGRIAFDVDLQPGPYTLSFDTGAWFAAAERDTFFPEVHVAFVVHAGQEHYHVAVLLSPYSYTTYRGS